MALLMLLGASPASAAIATQFAGPSTFDTAGIAHDPRVAINAQGDGALLWWAGIEIWAQTYAPGGFSAEERLNSDHEFAFQVSGPSIVVGDGGRVAAAWVLVYNDFNNGTAWSEAWANVFTPGVGWEGEHFLGAMNDVVGDTPVVAVGPGGRVYACFLDGTDLNLSYLRCALFMPGGPWQAEVTLANNSSGWFPSYARIVGDEQGVAIAWDMVDAAYTLSSVYGASYTIAGGWTAPQRLDSGTGEADVRDAQMTGSGARFLLIERATGAWTLRLITWTSAGGFDAGVDVAGPDPGLLAASVAADAGGNVTVAWTITLNASTRNLYGRYFSATTGWETAAPLEGVPGRVISSRVIADWNGGAIVVYDVSYAGANTTYWTRYAPGLGWLASQQIATTTNPVRSLAAASSPEYALAVWGENNISSSWVAVYELDRDTVAPALTFTSAPSLSNASTVLFAGSADLDTLISRDRIPVPVNRTTGGWSFTVTLPDGSYGIRLIATDIDLNTYTYTLPLVVDTVSSLEIVLPPSGSTNTTLVFGALSGVAEPGAVVTFNGAPVAVDGTGAFSEIIPLAFGLNRVEVVAVDPAGNRANRTVDIRQILSNQGIDEAKAEIANLTANLTGALAALADAQTELAALGANAAASDTEVASARARLTLAEGNVTELQAELGAANEALQAATAQATASEERAKAAEATASGAGTMALVGAILGAAGVAVGSLAFMAGRKPRRDEGAKSEPPKDAPRP